MKKRKALWIAALLAPAAGCAPASIGPLLQLSEQALVAESAHLEADALRDREHVASRRQLLADGFAADLAGRQGQPVDVAWHASAAEVYATARELLVRHEMALDAQRQRCRENLELAIAAQRRALQILQQRDALIRRVADPRLVRRLIETR